MSTFIMNGNDLASTVYKKIDYQSIYWSIHVKF